LPGTASQSSRTALPLIQPGRLGLYDLGSRRDPLKFAWEKWNELPKVEVKADMHCVTSWSKLDNVRMGVQAKTPLKMAKPKPGLGRRWCGGHRTSARRGGPMGRFGLVRPPRLPTRDSSGLRTAVS
jgi:hypothetical protein